MKLIPVEGDPFGESAHVRKLVPVKGNPFAEAPDDPGALHAAWLGFGRMADKMVQGGKQAALTVARAAGSDSARAELDRMAETEKLRDEGFAALREQHPVATTLGEAAPLMALPMGGSLRAAAAIGTLPGLLEYGTTEEKLKRGAAGAAGSGIGYGVGRAVGAAISPGMKAAGEETGRLAEVASREGVPLDAAQITGNQNLQSAKAALSRIPWTATGQQAKAAQQQGAFSAAVLRRMGADAREASPDVLADVYQAATQKMNGAAADVAITIDDKAVAAIADVEKKFLRRLPTDQKAIIRSYLDDLTEIIGREGALPGPVYAETRHNLGQLAWETNNSTVRESAKKLQKVLDDAFDRQASPVAVKAMHEGREEYHRYKTLEAAMKKSRSQGPVPAKQLYAQAQQDIPGFNRGEGGEWADLIRAGRQFLPDQVPNSGTPERLLYQNLLTAGSMSGIGALGGLAGGDPASGAALGLAGFGLSKGAQGLLNSPQFARYLTTKLLTEEEKALLARMGGTAGLLGAASAN